MPTLGYELHRHQLDNGLTLVVNPDPSSPGVAVNLWYRVGSADEVVGRTGFAHLFEHLMFAGTTSGITPGEHLAAMEAAGGHANATTSFDRTNYYETVQPGALDLALWLESERMVRLSITDTTFGTEREVVKEERRQRYDNVPYGDALELLMRLHFPGDHPYGHTPIGSMADLDDSTIDDVAAFYQRWYAPANAVLVLAGNITDAHAQAATEHWFGRLPRRERVPQAVVPDVVSHPEATVLTVERDVPKDAAYLGWRVPPEQHPDTMALNQALAILGHGQTSRLHRHLVRDAEVAEALGASTLGLARGANVAFISARTRGEHSLAELTDDVLTDVARLAADGPTEPEVARALAQYERELLSDLASIESRADQINAHTCVCDDPQRLNTELAQVQAITPADITRVTRQWLDPDRVATLHYRRTTR